MNLFHEQCVNVHTLFEYAVRPSLEQIYKSLSKGMKDKERKAELKGSIRELVETSRVLWDRSGQQRRKANHVALIRECRLICAWAQVRIGHQAVLDFVGISLSFVAMLAS